jgi:hypothetical protein
MSNPLTGQSVVIADDVRLWDPETKTHKSILDLAGGGSSGSVTVEPMRTVKRARSRRRPAASSPRT